MADALEKIHEAARREISTASEPARVEELRVKYLGKKGEISSVLATLGKLPPEERRSVGERVNKVKVEVEALLAEASSRADDAKLDSELRGAKVDVTLPGRGLLPGHRHPVSATLERVVRIF